MKKPTVSTNGNTAGRQPAHDSKAIMVLHLFASGHSLNRFEAATAGDTCLNSTVSELTHKYGLEFIRDWEKVPNRFGTLTKVLRYRLAPSELARANEIVRLANQPKPARDSLPQSNQKLEAWAQSHGHRQARPGESYSDYRRHLAQRSGK